MCRLARAEFASEPSAPAAARHWLSALLGRWELLSLADTALLLTSEVVTNAIRHVDDTSGAEVRASVADGFMEIGVVDGTPGLLPRLTAAADPTATTGRGLPIVDALSREWGNHPPS